MKDSFAEKRKRTDTMPLYRSRRNSMLGGVCGGIAEWLGWSPTWVRVLYVIGKGAGTTQTSRLTVTSKPARADATFKL